MLLFDRGTNLKIKEYTGYFFCFVVIFLSYIKWSCLDLKLQILVLIMSCFSVGAVLTTLDDTGPHYSSAKRLEGLFVRAARDTKKKAREQNVALVCRGRGEDGGGGGCERW